MHFLPLVRHTVTIGIYFFIASPNSPCSRATIYQIFLIRYQFSTLSKRINFVNHITIRIVAIWQRRSYSRKQIGQQTIAGILWHLWIIIASRLTHTCRIVCHLSRVKLTIHIAILPVILSIEAKRTFSSSTRKGISTVSRTIDKQIAFYISKGISLRVSTHNVTTILPIINDIVYILVFSFYLVVTSCVIYIKIAIERNVVRLHQASRTMRHQPLSHNTIRNRYVARNDTFVVWIDGKRLIQSPRERTMVEYHILSVGYTCRIFSRRAIVSHTETHIAYDNIV